MNESLLPSLLISGKCQLDDLFAIDFDNENLSDNYNFLFELFSIDPNEISPSNGTNGLLTAEVYSELVLTSDKVQRVLDFLIYINSSNSSLWKKRSAFHSPEHCLEIAYIIIFLLHSSFEEVDLMNFVINSILSFKNPPENLIKIVLSNFQNDLIYFFEDLFNFLVNNPSYQDQFRFLFKILYKENFSNFQLLCSLCIENKSFPNLFFPLMMEQELGQYQDWFLHTMASLFNFKENSNWFSDYFKTLPGNRQLYDMFIEKMTNVSEELLNFNIEQREGKEKIVKRLNFFNIILYLRSNFEIGYHEKLSDNLLKLIVAEKTLNEFNVDVIKFSICFFIYVRPMLINNKAKPLEDAYVFGLVDSEFNKFVKSITDQLNSFSSSPSMNLRVFSELLLLISAFSQNNSIAISESVTKILNFKLNSLGKLISAARKVIKDNHFSDFVLIGQQKEFPFTFDLNDASEGYLPIHYVLSVFQSNNIQRWKEFTPDWIYSQILASLCPIHSALPKLIEKYVESVIQAQDKINALECFFEMKKIKSHLITEDDILRGKSLTNIDIIMGKVVIFTYFSLLVFHYQLKYITTRPMLKNYFSLHSDFDSVPLTFVISHCQENLPSYYHIYPRLLELAILHFPHLICGENLLQDQFCVYSNSRCEENTKQLSSFSEINNKPDMNEIQTAIRLFLDAKEGQCSQKDYMIITKSIDYFYNLLKTNGIQGIFEHASVLCGEYLALFLEENSVFSRNWRFSHKFETIWKNLHLLMPKKIQTLSISWLLNDGPRSNKTNQRKRKILLRKSMEQIKQYISYEEIVNDPIENMLTVVDKRVFRSPQLFQIMIRTLESTLIASKSQWNFRINSRYDQLFKEGLVDEDPKKLKVALLIAQDVSIIQLLLEICLPTPKEASHFSRINNLRKIQLDVCSFIHYVFIADPYLVDIVNWHLYPFDLIEMFCSGVPSMHVLLENFPELVRLSGNLNKLIFYAKLIAKLSKYFNIRITAERASILISIIDCLSVCTSKDEFHPAIGALLPSLVEVCSYFPNLSNETITLIRKLSLICKAVNDETTFNDCMKATRKIIENSLFVKSIYF